MNTGKTWAVSRVVRLLGLRARFRHKWLLEDIAAGSLRRRWAWTGLQDHPGRGLPLSIHRD